MKMMLLEWLIASLVLLGTAYFIPGFEVQGFGAALFISVILGFANMVIRPILLILTLPLNIITLGLFTFVVNAIVLKLVAMLTPGFRIKTWKAAILGAIVIMLLTNTAYWLLYV